MVVVCTWLLTGAVGFARAAETHVGDFARDGLAGWERRNFEGETRYDLVEESGERVLRARTAGGATALYRERKIDLRETPFLEWEWKTGAVYEGADPYTKAGDDYPARVYVVVRLGFFPWQTRAINYVWGHPGCDRAWWPNPYTDKAAMVVLRKQPSQTWLSERVDVAADFERLFDLDVDELAGVAIMTDGDDGGREATAFYRRLSFGD